MLDYEDKLSTDAYTWTMQLAHTNSSLNPFLYYYFNPPIKQGFKNIFAKKISGKPKPKREETDSKKQTGDETFTNINVTEL